MTTGAEWQGDIGLNWARSWRMTDRAFTGITAHLLNLVRSLPGEEVLDIGCGAGELTMAIARQRASAEVTGIDISTDLIAAAQERAGDSRVAFRVADAASLVSERAPDLLVSRHGVMFFDDPPAAFAHLRAVAASGARLAFSCFRAPEENPWAGESAAAAGAPIAPADGYAPGPFGFRDPDFVRTTLAGAGWAGIRCEPHDVAFILGQGEDAAEQALAFLTRIGPAARALAELEDAARDLALTRIDKLIARYLRDGLVAFPAAIWLVTARN